MLCFFTAQQFYRDPSISTAAKSVLHVLGVRGNSQKKFGAERITSFRALVFTKSENVKNEGGFGPKNDRKSMDFWRFCYVFFTAQQFYRDPSISTAAKSVLHVLGVRGNSQKKIGAERIASFRALVFTKSENVKNGGGFGPKNDRKSMDFWRFCYVFSPHVSFSGNFRNN